MHRSAKRLLTEYIKTADELAALIGITPDALQRRAWRGKADCVEKGRYRGLLFFDMRDFQRNQEEIGYYRNFTKTQ